MTITEFIEAAAHNKIIQLVILAIVCDTVFGVLRAIKEKKFNSCAGIDGAIRKVGMLISLVFMLAIDVLIKINLIGFIPEQARTYLGLDTVGVAEFFALLYIAYEVVSIFKNMALCGLPVKKVWEKVREFLAKYTDELPDTDELDGDSTAGAYFVSGKAGNMNINRKISKYNFNKGSVSRIKYIVIHYVGALGGAEDNCRYYGGGNRNASAHYFVGFNGEVWQCVEDANIAWHCGASSYKHAECRNANSIGIEMCVRKKNTKSMGATDKDWYFEDATVEAAAELTRYLMNKYGVPASHVIRHYDVTGKICPNPYVYNTSAHTWDEFKRKISGQAETPQGGNEKTIWNFLTGKGLNAYAVAGIMGNLYAESGLMPNNLQNTYNNKLGKTDAEYTAAVDNGSYGNFVKDSAGYGLAQWTYWSRKQALLNHAKQAGVSIADLNMQLGFLWEELQGYTAVMDALKKAGSVRAASDAVLTGYEKPADQSETVKKKRAEYGEGYYKKYAAGNGTKYYRVRKSWTDAASQLGAFTSLENAKSACKAGYTVYDDNGKAVYAAARQQASAGVPFSVQVDILDLNIRTGAGTNYAKTGETTGKGVFTIVEVKAGQGASAGWGRLKSGAGWISLDYATRLA